MSSDLISPRIPKNAAVFRRQICPKQKGSDACDRVHSAAGKTAADVYVNYMCQQYVCLI